jgi:hypothetical protein
LPKHWNVWEVHPQKKKFRVCYKNMTLMVSMLVYLCDPSKEHRGIEIVRHCGNTTNPSGVFAACTHKSKSNTGHIHRVVRKLVSLVWGMPKSFYEKDDLHQCSVSYNRSNLSEVVVGGLLKWKLFDPSNCTLFYLWQSKHIRSIMPVSTI